MKFRVKSAAILVLILLNVILLGIVECIFRLFYDGYSTALFTGITIDKTPYLIPNQDYCVQYLHAADVEPPGFGNYLFKETKDENVFRIYVIGESTSEGFPYSKTEAFPFQIEQILNQSNLEKTAEVINFSMSAVSSHIGLAILKEAICHPPDLVIIYCGHNEFIGIGGAGAFKHPIFRLRVFLSKLRIYQALTAFIRPKLKKDNVELLHAMSRKSQIPLTSRTYGRTMKEFRANYAHMIRLCRKRNIPVIACGVAANLKDLPPVSSIDGKDENAVKQVRRLFENGEDRNSAIFLNGIVGSDAFASFVAGQELLKRNHPEDARFFLQKACDLDTRRLRASSDINRIIAELCRANNCIYVDMQHLLDSRDSDGIAGNRQLLEHIHPDIASTTLIARLLADTIGGRFFGGIDTNGKPAVLFRTLVEKECAAGKIAGIFSQFPFDRLKYFNTLCFEELYHVTPVSSEPQTYQMTLRNQADKHVLSLIREYFSNGKDEHYAHLKLGIRFLEDGDPNRAFQEFLTVYHQNPFNPIAVNNLAVWYIIHGNRSRGEFLLSQIYVMGFREWQLSANLWLLFHENGNAGKKAEIEDLLGKMGIDVRSIKSFNIIDPP